MNAQTSFTPRGPDGLFAGLPVLTGSEKQVAWATGIRVKALTTAWGSLNIADMRLRLAACDLFEQLLAVEDARWWIDHRGDCFDIAAVATKAAVEALKASSPCAVVAQ